MSDALAHTGPVSVQAVATTGIYCRPTCSATPLERNVSLMATPVAAEAAGYRPCLRCRPDRHLLVAEAASGSPPAVVAALALVSDGFLDHASEDALARRVGYSTRQLRRLFQHYVGASPDFVARSRRAHFARRLLDESDLPLQQVARAAGFSGVRQLHRAMTRVFGFSPSELRAKRRRDDVLVADGGLRLRVPGPTPYDPAALGAHFDPRVTAGVESLDGFTYRRALSTCGNDGVIEVDFAEPTALVVTAHLPTFDSLIDDVARVRSLFGADRDWSDARTVLSDDPLLGPAVTRWPSVTVPGAWDRFETAVRVIIGQQVSVRGASTITARLVQRRGKPFRAPLDQSEWSITHQFPTADRLADLDRHDDGSSLGMPGARVGAIAGLARAVCDGSVDLSGPTDDVRAALLDLPGIGPWTVEVIAQRALGDPDAFPAGDLGIRQAIGRLMGADSPPSTDAAAAAADAWRGHRALAAQYLWTSLHQDLQQEVMA